MSNVPTSIERKALRRLIGGEWVSKADLFVANDETINNLVHRTWIERHPESVRGREMYRITEIGKRAYDEPRPKKEPPKHKLSTLKPRLSELPPLMGSPRDKRKREF